MTNPILQAAFELGVAVHGFLSARMGGEIETKVVASDNGVWSLIAGDVDFLLEVIASAGPVLRDAGHGDLVDQARSLADGTGDLPAIRAAGLFERLMALAGIDPDQLLPLAVPPAGTSE